MKKTILAIFIAFSIISLNAQDFRTWEHTGNYAGDYHFSQCYDIVQMSDGNFVVREAIFDNNNNDIDYKLPCENSTAIMTIVNSLGVKVIYVELTGEQGTRTIDLRDMPAGVYSYIVRCGEYIQNGKVMIVSK